MKLRSVNHLIDRVVNYVSGCNAFVKNIHEVNGFIFFDAYCQQDKSIYKMFCERAAKYHIYIGNTSFEKEFVIHCYISEVSHPQLFRNYNNIVKRYEKARSILSAHKRLMDAKIEHQKQILWKRNEPKFTEEIRNVELEKFQIYLQYGVDTIKLN